MTRRYRRRPSHRLLLLAMLVAVIATRYAFQRFGQRDHVAQAHVLREGLCQVARVVDGDTLIVRQTAAGRGRAEPLATEEGRLRLLGIDCPESVKPGHPIEPWGPEAANFARQFVAQSTHARLRLDRRRVDRFERFLAYVYVNDKMLNEELVRAGLARVSTFPGDSPKIERQLRDAEHEARAAGRGIWSPAPEGTARPQP